MRSAVLAAIRQIAPEVDVSTIRTGERLRSQVDLDSMDFLNLVIVLHEQLQVDIPEADYARLTTIDEIVAYLEERVGKRTPA